MTAIVGLVHDGEVWLGGDRSVAAGSMLIPNRQPKVWRSGQMVIGCSGEQAWWTAWLEELSPDPGGHWRPDDPLRWLSTTCMQSLRQRLTEWGRIGKAADGTEQCDGDALVGIDGQLYEINANGFTVVQCADPVAGIGCGGNLVIGAASALRALDWPDGLDVPWVLRESLEIAERFCAYVRAPFDVVTTGAQP